MFEIVECQGIKFFNKIRVGKNKVNKNNYKDGVFYIIYLKSLFFLW